MERRDEIIRIAVGEQQIKVTIVVIVKKLQSPSAHEFSGSADARGKGQVVKRFVMIVFIYGEHFAVEVRYEQAHPSIIIEIGRIHAHARSCPAAITVSNAGSRRDLIKLSLATIDKQKIGHRVIAHPEVNQSVVVDIGRNRTPHLAEMTGDAGLVTDIGESAVSIIRSEERRVGKECRSSWCT